MNRFVLARDAGQRIPLTVVGGPQGAGKTTLLRRLLTHSDGRRIAVVLDHPPSLALEPLLIARSDGNSLVLHNGSACWGLDGDIGTALSTMHARSGTPMPDHVVVEAAASASPVRMSGYMYLPGFRPGGVVGVVSAAQVAELKEQRLEADSALDVQLQHAELLVLNQVDRVEASMRAAVHRWLQQRAVRARLIESERCHIPAAMLLGANARHAPLHAIRGVWSPSYAVDGTPRRSQISQPRHVDDYRAWVLTTREAVDTVSFRHWVDLLPDSILRGEGELRIRGEPGHRFRFHHCGGRWSLSRGEPWGLTKGEPVSWVSLVGLASRAVRASTRADDSGLPVSGVLAEKQRLRAAFDSLTSRSMRTLS
jgi:G3E family GTPase